MRRRPGEGQVDQLPSGRWRVRVVVEGRRTSLGTYATEDEANEALQGARAVVSDGVRVTGPDRLESYGERVLALRRSGGIRRGRSAHLAWQNHVVGSDLGTKRLAAITPADVRAWHAGLRGLRHATARQYLALVRRVLSQAVEDGILESNPARITVPRGRDPQGWTYLTIEEQRQLLGCEAVPAGDRACIAFAIYTGLRAGELCALRASDVVLGESPHVVVRYGGPPDFPTKTGKTRVVPLLPPAVAAWEAWQVHRPKSVAAWPAPRGGFRPPDSPLGMGTRPPSSNGKWREALRAAGITRRVRWHDLRHTCGTSLLHGWWGERLALDEVRDWLGHSTVAMTERYAHAVPEGVFTSAAKVTRGSRGGPVSAGIAGILPAIPRALAASSTESEEPSVPGSYDVSWGDRGADALRSMLAGDPGPAVALVSEAIEARRSGDALERAWSRWVATGRPAALVDAIEVLRSRSRAAPRREEVPRG